VSTWPTSKTGGASVPEDERTVEEVLDTIGDEHARTVLAAISREPRSAKELSDARDRSLPTIHRHVGMLEEHDLVVTRTHVAADGNRYEECECNSQSTVISLETDQYDVEIYREENLPDRFTRLWDDLGAV